MLKLNKKIYTYLPFGFFFLYVMWLLRNTVLVTDDLFYYTDLQKYNSILGWCKAFYMGWGGRVPVQLLEIFFLHIPVILIRTTIALAYTMVGIYISYITNILNDNISERKKIALNIATCLFLYFIQINVVEGSVLWISGAFNYIIPILALLMCLIPSFKLIVGKTCGWLEYMIAFLLTILSAYTEQTSAVLVCVAAFSLVYCIVAKKKVPKLMYILVVFFIVNTIIQFMAPGNAARSDSEMILWFNQFDMYNLWDKIAFGLIHTAKQLFENSFIFIVCLVVLLAIISIPKGKINLGVAAVISFVSVIIRALSLEKIDDSVITDASNKTAYVFVFLVVIWILGIGVLIMDAFDWSVKGIITGLFGWAALCTGMVMGFSPTIYASGSRVFMICYIFLIMEIVHLMSYISIKTSFEEE